MRGRGCSGQGACSFESRTSSTTPATHAPTIRFHWPNSPGIQNEIPARRAGCRRDRARLGPARRSCGQCDPLFDPHSSRYPRCLPVFSRLRGGGHDADRLAVSSKHGMWRKRIGAQAAARFFSLPQRSSRIAPLNRLLRQLAGDMQQIRQRRIMQGRGVALHVTVDPRIPRRELRPFRIARRPTDISIVGFARTKLIPRE